MLPSDILSISNMQNDLLGVIVISQKRVFVREYAGIRSTRQVFTKVIISASCEQVNMLVYEPIEHEFHPYTHAMML